MNTCAQTEPMLLLQRPEWHATTRDYDLGYSDGFWSRPMPMRPSEDYISGFYDGIQDSYDDLI